MVVALVEDLPPISDLAASSDSAHSYADDWRSQSPMSGEESALDDVHAEVDVSADMNLMERLTWVDHEELERLRSQIPASAPNAPELSQPDRDC